MAEVVRLMGQVLSASAHETGVTHRDVKPANILLSPRHNAVFTDFSIASIQEAQRLTQTGAMVGTPRATWLPSSLTPSGSTIAPTCMPWGQWSTKCSPASARFMATRWSKL